MTAQLLDARSATRTAWPPGPGIDPPRRRPPADAGQRQAEDVVDELTAAPDCTGYIVQFPLPRHLDANAVLTRMEPAKDADGLHPVDLGRLVLGVDAPLPCTGARVRVVGRGITVTLCHTGTEGLARHVREADIVVAAAGSPGPITKDTLRPGAAVLDVGITRTEHGGVGSMPRAMPLANVVEAAERNANPA
ncbi:hypothetical protein BIV25_06850 [Streptomyces sp. MUSC 14]|uniref:tetrahydrofolate dehydrogenase/cyclohydrolase catalytic domain-containing protein n=1 Tax=Streptomyces sp. MUSC 14 TaxID=1354889 RepID=UPI0008F591F9|nr:tetrahydrofolate dehydrogenase/cyclohydrolase catalytic domain-containing protein [Streptomyces sp. MUSC 14]OIK00842.1 hypothetical protein BIV25_06850 [Streptomyces sp. MUSC 14]